MQLINYPVILGEPRSQGLKMLIFCLNMMLFMASPLAISGYLLRGLNFRKPMEGHLLRRCLDPPKTIPKKHQTSGGMIVWLDVQGWVWAGNYEVKPTFQYHKSRNPSLSHHWEVPLDRYKVNLDWRRDQKVGVLYRVHMDVSENSGTPKSSILIGFSIINHPFWGTPIFGNTHINQTVVILP